MKSSKDKIIRDKYVAKHYGSWTCGSSCPSNGGDGAIMSSPPAGKVTSLTTPVRSFSPRRGTSPYLPSQGGGRFAAAFLSTPTADTPLGVASIVKPNGRSGGRYSVFASPSSVTNAPAPATDHDKAAMLMGILSSNGITVETLLQMDEKAQHETLLRAASKEKAPSNEGEGENKPSSTPVPPSRAEEKSYQTPVIPSFSELQRKDAVNESAGLSMSANRAGSNSVKKKTKKSSAQKDKEDEVVTTGLKMQDDPKFAKYVKMVQVRSEFIYAVRIIIK